MQACRNPVDRIVYDCLIHSPFSGVMQCAMISNTSILQYYLTTLSGSYLFEWMKQQVLPFGLLLDLLQDVRHKFRQIPYTYITWEKDTENLTVLERKNLKQLSSHVLLTSYNGMSG